MPFARIRVGWRALVRTVVTLFVYDIFISYARRDGRHYARAVHRLLEQQGMIAFLDDSDIAAGDALNISLERALKKTRLLVVIATDGASQSPHVQLEIATYVRRKRPIVPIDFVGSYANGNWPVLRDRNPVWIAETAAALAAGPSAETIGEITKQLHSAGGRAVARRVIAMTAILLLGLAAAGLWSYRRASVEARHREAQQLVARAALTLDGDQDPLGALGFAVAAQDVHQSVEAPEIIARALPYARTPVGAHRIGRLATVVSFSPHGRFLLTRGRLETPQDVLGVLAISGMASVVRIEQSSIGDASISPDERFLAVVDRGECVSLHSLVPGLTSRCLDHPGVAHLAFAGSAGVLVTASVVGTDPAHATTSIRRWNLAQDAPLSRLDFAGSARSIAVSPDGAHVAVGVQTAHVGGTLVCLWASNGDECVPVARLDTPLRGGRLWESANVQFSDDGRLLLVVEATSARVLDAPTGRERRRIVDSTGIGRVLVTSKGSAVVTTSTSGALILHGVDGANAEFLGHLPHPGRILSFAASADERHIVTAADDGIVRLWDAGLARADGNDFTQSVRLTGLASHGENRTTYIRSRREAITSVAFSPDGMAFATAGGDGWVRTWKTQPEPEVGWRRHGQWVAGLAAIPESDRFLSASEFSGRVWGLHPLRELHRLDRHGNDLTGVAVSRDGSVAVTAGSDGSLYVFGGPDLRKRREIYHDKPAEQLIRAALAADGQLVATTSSDRFVKIWRTGDGSLYSQRQLPTAATAFAFHPHAARIAVATGATLTLYDSHDWHAVTWPTLDSSVHSLTFDHTGRRVMAGLENGTAVMLEDGGVIWVGAHAAAVTAAHFSPDSRFVLTGGHDRMARIWDAKTGEERARQGVPFRIDAVQFANAGRMIVVAGENYVRVSPWRAPDLIAVGCRIIQAVEESSRRRLLPVLPPGTCGAQEASPHAAQ